MLRILISLSKLLIISGFADKNGMEWGFVGCDGDENRGFGVARIGVSVWNTIVAKFAYRNRME